MQAGSAVQCIDRQHALRQELEKQAGVMGEQDASQGQDKQPNQWAVQ